MKDSYLCIVNESVRECSQGTKNLFSGLTDFTACPARKNGRSNDIKDWRLKIKTNQLKIITSYGNESESSREATEVWQEFSGCYRYVMSPVMYSSQNQGGDNGGGDDSGMDRFRCKKAAIEREQC